MTTLTGLAGLAEATADPEAKPRLELPDAVDTARCLTDTPPARTGLLRTPTGAPWFSAGSVSLLAARGGSGKTRLLARLAGVIAAGEGEWLHGIGLDYAIQGRGAPVLAVFGEESPDEIHRTIYRIGEQHPEQHAALRRNMHMVSLSSGIHVPIVDQDGEQGEGIEVIARRCDEIGAKLLILDPSISFFEGEENDNTQAQRYIEGLRRLAEGRAVMVATHTAKSAIQGSADAARGAAALRDGARAMFAMGSKDGDIFVAAAKMNYAPTGNVWWLRWSDSAHDFLPISTADHEEQAEEEKRKRIEEALKSKIEDDALKERLRKRAKAERERAEAKRVGL